MDQSPIQLQQGCEMRDEQKHPQPEKRARTRVYKWDGKTFRFVAEFDDHQPTHDAPKEHTSDSVN